MKQIGLGLMQYTQDFDEKFPLDSSSSSGTPDYSNPSNSALNKANWINATQPYIKSWQVFACPSSKPHTDIAYPTYIPTDNSKNSYHVNGVIVRDRVTGTGLNQSAIPETAATIFLQEQTNSTAYSTTYPNSQTPATTTPLTFSQVLSSAWNALHFDGGNFLFCDGHVKWRKQTSIKVGEFGLKNSTAATTASTNPCPDFSGVYYPMF